MAIKVGKKEKEQKQLKNYLKNKIIRKVSWNKQLTGINSLHTYKLV